MSEPEDTQAGDSLGRHSLPPATFDFLILSLRAQTEMQLGLFHFGEEAEKPAPDFDLARHTIDMMTMYGLAASVPARIGTPVRSSF